MWRSIFKRITPEFRIAISIEVMFLLQLKVIQKQAIHLGKLTFYLRMSRF